jgi:hypothetical protein
MNLDEQLLQINTIINEIYNDINKNDDREDYPFSILKLGLLTWRNRVYNKCAKNLNKCSKIIVRQYLKHIKIELMNRKYDNKLINLN